MALDKTALAVTIIGALNWLLVGLFSFDLVAFISGGGSTMLARIIYAVIGIPVSSAQALVGGSLGIGLIKREKIGIRPLINIFIGWITTPLISCVLCYGIYFVIKNWIGYP